MISMITPEKLKDPRINPDADHLADSLHYALYTALIDKTTYICVCSKCGFKYYTEIKQCNCPHCGCDGEHFRCTELE